MNEAAQAFAELLQQHGGYGLAGLMASAWLYERHQNTKLQRWVVRISTAGLKLADQDVTK